MNRIKTSGLGNTFIHLYNITFKTTQSSFQTLMAVASDRRNSQGGSFAALHRFEVRADSQWQSEPEGRWWSWNGWCDLWQVRAPSDPGSVPPWQVSSLLMKSAWGRLACYNSAIHTVTQQTVSQSQSVSENLQWFTSEQSKATGDSLCLCHNTVRPIGGGCSVNLRKWSPHCYLLPSSQPGCCSSVCFS